MALTKESIGKLVALTGGTSSRAVHPDEMSQSSGISWQTGNTINPGLRAYMPSVNFNKRLERNKRYFGSFFCHRCKSSWHSGHAFQKHYQKCRTCNRRTYPNKLRALNEGSGGVLSVPHPEDKCQRCKKLGRPCTEEPAGRDSGVDVLDEIDEDHDQHAERRF